MIVLGGSTDVTTYFALRLAADGTNATGLTITNLDLQYVRSGAAPVAKVDATALAATNSAHGDNQAIEVDATDQPGLYRVDWPDAAFAAGVREVILTVKESTCFTEHLRVTIDPLVVANSITAGAITAAAIATGAIDADTIADNAIDAGAIASGAITSAKFAAGAIDATAIANAAIDAATFAAGAIDAAALAADAGTEIATAVWASGTRTLTVLDEDSTTLDLDATIRAAVGLAAANLDTQIDAIPTAAENAAGLLDLAAGVETGLTVRQHMRLEAAVQYGKASGMGTTTAVLRNFGDSKDRVTATVDADGNRTAVTTDAT